MKKQKLYISLYEQLKNQIIEGQYQAQDKFPSKRQLSEHLSLVIRRLSTPINYYLMKVLYTLNHVLAIMFPIFSHYLSSI